MMNLKTSLAVAAASLAVFSPHVDASVITLDMTDTGPGVTSLSAVGGYIPASWIQNISNDGSGTLIAKSNTTLASLMDSTGISTTVGITSSSGWTDGWYNLATGFATTIDDDMMTNYSEVSETGVVTFTGLSAWLSSQGATAYNIYVMSYADTVLGAATFTVGGQSHYLANGSGGPIEGPYQLGSFATLADAKAAPNTANMVKFSNVTGDSFTLNVIKDSDIEGWIPINMIQIEAIPEPSTALLGGLGALALLRRRRNG